MAIRVLRIKGTLLECDGKWVRKISKARTIISFVEGFLGLKLGVKDVDGRTKSIKKCLKLTVVVVPENLDKGESINLSGVLTLPMVGP